MSDTQELNDAWGVTSVTPEIAREWLLSNTHNRNLRQRVVLAYAADMEAGNWQWNGESIKFAEDGTLLDGQHRLAAIAESGVTLSMLVVRGLPNQTQETVDGGAKRKFSDVLHLRGERVPLVLAAIIRRVGMWDDGKRWMQGTGVYGPTNAQMLQVLEKYPWLRDLAQPAQYVAVHCGMPASIIGFGWWLFSMLDGEDTSGDVEFFFERLGDGQGLVKGDPIYELRRAVENSRSVRGQRSERYLTAIMIKSWNAYRDGVKIGLLTFRPGGEKPERFPLPH
jgi:hypothetical protein